ncbi:hypothetical protein BH10CYA1_BH10CYA1_49100 [soil metagenome]
MRSHNLKITSCFAATSIVFLNGLSTMSATLYGGVNHSDFLAPVDPVKPVAQQTLVPQQATPQTVDPTLGASVSRSATVDNPAIEWFPIPNWMAGKWSKKGDITESVTDLRTGITTPMNQFIDDYMTVTWGYQTDSQGNVWHANLVPSERIGESQGKSVSFLIVNLKILEATPQNLATRTHYIVKESVGREVSDMFQQESLTHYQLVGGNEQMDAISSNRVFTYQGQPQRDGKLISHYTKSNNFEPLPTKQGIDLAASLNQYLKSHNMAGLAKQVNAVNPNGIGNSFGNGMTGGFSSGTSNANMNGNSSNGNLPSNPPLNGRSIRRPVQQIDPNNPF